MGNRGRWCSGGEDDGGRGLEGDDPLGTLSSKARRGKDNAGFVEMDAEYERGSDSDSGSDGGSDDSKTDVDDLSDGEKAELMAMGKKMINKKQRVRSPFILFFFGVRVRVRVRVRVLRVLRVLALSRFASRRIAPSRPSHRVPMIIDSFFLKKLIGIV